MPKVSVIAKWVLGITGTALMVAFFQNCSKGFKTVSPSSLAASSSTPASSFQPSTDMTTTCAPGKNQACSENNGSGNKVCKSNGNGFGSCVLSSCDPGYQLEAGTCLANNCTPGSVVSCMGINGAGQKTCSAVGDGFGPCVLSSCNAGFNMQSGSCIANACVPGSNMACTAGQGSGNKVCNSMGTGYGACLLSSCDSGYNLQNGSCVQNTCTPGASATCAFNNGIGLKLCNSLGSGYGSCAVSSCDQGYHLSNLPFPATNYCIVNECTSPMISNCTANNGSGTRQCQSNGVFGACVLSSCSSGYNLQGGSCVQNACQPGSVTACFPLTGSGSGVKTCNSYGSGFGSCVINTCGSNENLQNGVCVANACTPNSTANCKPANGQDGGKTCNSQGSAYGACRAYNCDSGYHLEDGACVQNVCSAYSEANCSELNGSGKKTCNEYGTGYGSCQLTQCNSGYFLGSNSVCLLNVCTPGQTATCSDASGSGLKTCNSSGSAYENCIYATCNQGYNLNTNNIYGQNQCTANVCQPNQNSECRVGDAIGTKTCNANGSGYLDNGACTLTGCIAGMFLENGICYDNSNMCTDGKVGYIYDDGPGGFQDGVRVCGYRCDKTLADGEFFSSSSNPTQINARAYYTCQGFSSPIRITVTDVKPQTFRWNSVIYMSNQPADTTTSNVNRFSTQ